MPTTYIIVCGILYFILPEIGNSQEIYGIGVSLGKARATELLKHIDLVNDLIVKLTGAMLTGVAAIVVKGKEWSKNWNFVDSILIVIVFLGGAVSYYGTYLVHIRLLEMLAIGDVNIFSTRIQAALSIQYNGFLFGIFQLGLVFTRMLSARIPSSTEI